MKQISIDSLNQHLFETIEMLKNNTDKQAEPHEKIDIKTAQAIADLGKVVIEGYKVKAQVLKMVNPLSNPTSTNQLLSQSGFFDSNIKVLDK